MRLVGDVVVSGTLKNHDKRIFKKTNDHFFIYITRTQKILQLFKNMKLVISKLFLQKLNH